MIIEFLTCNYPVEKNKYLQLLSEKFKIKLQ